MEEQIKRINEHYELPAHIQQLAEECSELAKACSKFARANGQGYDTNISVDEALSALKEEISDVEMCIRHVCMKIQLSWEDIESIARQKTERQLQRIGGYV